MTHALQYSFLGRLALLPTAGLAPTKPPLPQVSKVLISGPGLARPIEVADAHTLRALGVSGRALFSAPGKEPSPQVFGDPDYAYVLTRYTAAGPWDRMYYYLNPVGGSSYIFYTGLVGGGTSAFDERWFRVAPASGRTLRRLLAAHGVRLAPVQSSLSPAAQGCPPAPPPKVISPDFGPATGSAPVGAISFSRGITLYVGNPKWVTRTQYGWTRKNLWVIKPSYKQTVTLLGGDLRRSMPLWFQIGTSAPNTAPVLDPQLPGVPEAIWPQYPSYLFIPRAGCYFVKARWPGGMWQRTFAAGR